MGERDCETALGPNANVLKKLLYPFEAEETEKLVYAFPSNAASSMAIQRLKIKLRLWQKRAPPHTTAHKLLH
ncbi:MAG TPA: hypothetical protein VN901_10795 [Candidatus Acidoferrales bacterium]|nr:hypothetical protein [Candidatus Acidoferrales bacterium]